MKFITVIFYHYFMSDVVKIRRGEAQIFRILRVDIAKIDIYGEKTAKKSDFVCNEQGSLGKNEADT